MLFDWSETCPSQISFCVYPSAFSFTCFNFTLKVGVILINASRRGAISGAVGEIIRVRLDLD